LLCPGGFTVGDFFSRGSYSHGRVGYYPDGSQETVNLAVGLFKELPDSPKYLKLFLFNKQPLIILEKEVESWGKSGRIAILSGGGDCPGINAVIRAVAKKAMLEHDLEVIGIEDGYDGAILNHYRKLSFKDVSGILTQGGTILGTSNKANPYRYARKINGDLEINDVSKETIVNLKTLGIDCLVCIGGDGTLNIANHLYNDGIPIVGVPKTIDNDIIGTEITFGFDSAVGVATEAIDRLHSTAQSHHRVMAVEVMGRNAGWIALHAGVAGGGDIILIPEIPYKLDAIVKKVRNAASADRGSVLSRFPKALTP
jgi:6-phosphofructokinase 1